CTHKYRKNIKKSLSYLVRALSLIYVYFVVKSLMIFIIIMENELDMGNGFCRIMRNELFNGFFRLYPRYEKHNHIFHWNHSEMFQYARNIIQYRTWESKVLV